jgi:hypothetical protein
MTRSFTFKQPAYNPARAALALLVLVMFAPAAAQAGCSHLVTPGIDSERFRSLIEPLIHDLADQSEELPVAPAPRPCSGALCSGQPATPAAPAVDADIPSDSWAWNASVSGVVLTGVSILSIETRELHPTCLAIPVFRPPPSLLEAV